LWDRLFGTYVAQPAAGHEAMTIGIEQFRNARELGLDRMLVPALSSGCGPLSTWITRGRTTRDEIDTVLDQRTEVLASVQIDASYPIAQKLQRSVRVHAREFTA
jgi:hypothetical protein